MNLKTMILFICGLSSSVVHAAEWTYVSPKNQTYLDVNSLRTYPGLVVGDLKRIQDQNFVTYSRVAYLCGGKYFILAGFDSRSTAEPEAEIQLYLGAGEPVTYLSEDTEIPKKFSAYCGRPYSKVQIEIPNGKTKDQQSVFLAKETLIDGNTITTWTKLYKTKIEKLMHKGKVVKVEGKPLEYEAINKSANVTLDKIEVDCRNSKIRFISTAVYKHDGTLISTKNFNQATDTIPGSFGRQQVDVLCSLKSDK